MKGSCLTDEGHLPSCQLGSAGESPPLAGWPKLKGLGAADIGEKSRKQSFACPAQAEVAQR